jgi:hypothetical protein
MLNIFATGLRRRAVWQMAVSVSQQHTAAIFTASSANADSSEELQSHTVGDRSALQQQHRTCRRSYNETGNSVAARVRTHRYWEHRKFVNATFIIIITMINLGGRGGDDKSTTELHKA